MSSDTSDFETMLELYQDQYRRAVLAVLIDEQQSLTVNDLTKTVVKHISQASITEVSADVLTQVQISLHHVHLPKMTEAGLIEYDPESGIVEPTEQFDQVKPQLSALIEADPAFEPPLQL